MAKKEQYIKIKDLSVSKVLYDFINKELFKGLDIEVDDFWSGFNKAIHDLAPKNKKLLDEREKLQKQIDYWHMERKGKVFDIEEYTNFFKKIGYLKEVGKPFKINPENVDDEISSIAGPQLVVPIMNARYTLNAANARWVSLYDSLYGTDVIQSEEGGGERYDPLRGQQVINYCREFLDKHFQLDKLSWKKINKIEIHKNTIVLFKEKEKFYLKEKSKFIGFRGEKDKPTAIILKNNNLHLEIIINPKAFSAKGDSAGISDIIIESAISTICDNEDSVAAVDADDKVICYRNWLGLMKGTLNSEFEKKVKNI